MLSESSPDLISGITPIKDDQVKSKLIADHFKSVYEQPFDTDARFSP